MNAQIKDKDLVQVRVSGSAGQGSILCGVMLAQAAASAGRVVAQSARYGAAAPGKAGCRRRSIRQHRLVRWQPLLS